MNNLIVSRETPLSVITPVIPLNFVYPGLSLPQLMSIIWAHRTLSILLILLVLSLSALTLKLWPRTYTATATLMVNYEVNDPLNGKELPVGQIGSFIATQIELMQTTEALLTVVDRLQLTQNKHYVDGYNGKSGTLQQWVTTKLRENLKITQGQQGSQLIYLTYSAIDPSEAAQVPNALVQIYQEQTHLRSTGPPGERAKHYAEQLTELKKKVDQAQQRVTTFHVRNNLIDQGNLTKVDMVLLATLEGRLLEAQNIRRSASAHSYGDQSVSDKVLSSPEVQSLKTQLATQELHLAQLNSLYTPKHPDVLAFKSQIETTRLSLAAALQRYTANAVTELTVAQRLEQDLQKAVTAQRNKVLTIDQLHSKAAKYLLELESAQAVYKQALAGYDQIMFAAAGAYTNISVVSLATPPAKASKPNIKNGIILGGLMAGILGFGIPLLYELFNRRVRCRDDLERLHGISVLTEFDALPIRAAA